MQTRIHTQTYITSFCRRGFNVWLRLYVIDSLMAWWVVQNSTACGCLEACNTLRPKQYGRHFADDIFKCIFLNENAWILLGISLKFVSKVQINNIPALVQIMAWRRPGDKPLSEPMVVSLLTHICVTRPQWVNLRWRKVKHVHVIVRAALNEIPNLDLKIA